MNEFKEIMDEYYLKESGLARGHLGSMNLSNTKKNIVYSSSILGNNIPVSSGFALGNKLYNNSRVVLLLQVMEQ